MRGELKPDTVTWGTKPRHNQAPGPDHGGPEIGICEIRRVTNCHTNVSGGSKNYTNDEKSMLKFSMVI